MHCGIVLPVFNLLAKLFDISLPLPLLYFFLPTHFTKTASIWRQVSQKSKSGRKKGLEKEERGGGGETTQQLSYEEEEELAKSRFSLVS